MVWGTGGTRRAGAGTLEPLLELKDLEENRNGHPNRLASLWASVHDLQGTEDGFFCWIKGLTDILVTTAPG